MIVPSHRLRLLPLYSLLLGAMPLGAQTAARCPNGSADDRSIRIDATVAVPLLTLYHVGDSILTVHGFQWTAASPVSARITAPRSAAGTPRTLGRKATTLGRRRTQI